MIKTDPLLLKYVIWWGIRKFTDVSCNVTLQFSNYWIYIKFKATSSDSSSITLENPVFKDINGTEIDRIIGYLPPDLFLQELKRIHSGKGTFPDLKNKLYNDSTNFSILFELSQKYATMGDKNTAHIYIRKILNMGKEPYIIKMGACTLANFGMEKDMEKAYIFLNFKIKNREFGRMEY